jgi:hypothetical protein
MSLLMLKTPSLHASRACLASACVLLLWVAGAGANGPAPQAVPVVQFSEAPGSLAGDFVGPELSVYADGWLLVVFPPMMRRAGSYSLQLEPDALAALLESVISPGVMGFDAQQTREAMDSAPEILAKRGIRPGPGARGDATISTFSVDPDAVSGAQKQGRPGQTIRWRGVAEDAMAHPDLDGLQALERARRALRAQIWRDDLVPR